MLCCDNFDLFLLLLYTYYICHKQRASPHEETFLMLAWQSELRVANAKQFPSPELQRIVKKAFFFTMHDKLQHIKAVISLTKG